MALDFPSPPGAPGTIYSGPTSSWQWDGAKWGAAGAVNYLPLAGGTMLGSLNLYADAGAPFEAVTLRQLQSTVGGSGFLPLTGGTINPGPLLVAPGATAPRTLTLRGDTTGSIGETAVESGAIALRLGYTSTVGSVRVAVIGQENVNAIEIKALSGAPVIFASGSAADVDLAIQGRGASGVLLGSTTNFQNKVRVVGAAAGLDPSISAFGSDTNIDLFLQGKGAGTVQIGRTTSFFTPKGNLMLGMPEPASMSTSDGINGATLRAWYTVANNYMTALYYDGTSYRRLNTLAGGQMYNSAGSFSFQTATAGTPDTTVVPTTVFFMRADNSAGTGAGPPSDAAANTFTTSGLLTHNWIGWNIYNSTSNWRFRAAGAGVLAYADPSSENITFYTAAAGAAGAVAAIGGRLSIGPSSVSVTGALTAAGTISTTGINNYITSGGHDSNNYGFTSSYGCWLNGSSWINQLSVGGSTTFGGAITLPQLMYCYSAGSFTLLQCGGYGFRIADAFVQSGGYGYQYLIGGNPNWDYVYLITMYYPGVAGFRLAVAGSCTYDIRHDGGISRSTDGAWVSWVASDTRLKTNVKPSEVDALALLRKIPIESFDWIEEIRDGIHPPTAEEAISADNARSNADKSLHVQLGWIAQHVQEVMPDWVKVSRNTPDRPAHLPEYMHRIDPQHAGVPYLIRAIQQIADRLDAAGIP